MTNAAPSAGELEALDRYFRITNYLAAAQIYLRDNALLEAPLAREHLKPRPLGHWGTAPGINFIYTHLNRLVRTKGVSALLVTGPGHGAPANLANLFLEGTLGEFYPELMPDRRGVERLVKGFSWPGGFPSHLAPMVPGVIHEGGELGYALATAFGAALDNPGLLVACVVGDGEAETGPTAAAWHSASYLDPAGDGAVLPILHLNGYKISSATVFGAMADDELRWLFSGCGYEPHVVTVGTAASPSRHEDHRRMAAALDEAHEALSGLAAAARGGATPRRPRWPLIILRSPKGWTGVRSLRGEPVEGSFRSHQVPLKSPAEDGEELEALAAWLASYRPRELFDDAGRPREGVLATCPRGPSRMGMNPHAHGGPRRELARPPWRDYAARVPAPGAVELEDVGRLGQYLRDVVRKNPHTFRIMCPDEMVSNRLEAVFEATVRQFARPVDPRDDFVGRRGRVLEVLSEHTCQGWVQGYLLTGRHALYPSYEAFAPVVDSMLNQYAKFLKQAGEVPWRKPLPSLTYLLTSEGWRQDHNGYSHQGPGFINNLLTKKARHVRIYLPPDANCLLSTIDHCLTSLDKINLVVASKQKTPQWLSAEEAARHCERGASVWGWAGSEGEGPPDVVIACAGAYPTAEAVAAARLLRGALPSLRVRVVNVTDLLILERDTFHPHGLSGRAFDELFTPDRPVVFNFHGYPSAVKQLLFDRPSHERFQINGYIEEGTTTTPFLLLAMNGVDRYRVAAQAAAAAPARAPGVAEARAEAIARFGRDRDEACAYAKERGVDHERVRSWGGP